MAAGELELSRLDVDAGKPNAREFLPEDGEYRADSAADVEQARPGVEPGSVADQAVSPVLCLLDQPLLLAGSVTMNVLGYATRSGTGRNAASTTFLSCGGRRADAGAFLSGAGWTQACHL